VPLNSPIASLPLRAAVFFGSSVPSSDEHHLPLARVLVILDSDQGAPSTAMLHPCVKVQVTAS
jgi:hypothetical protein